MFRCQLCGELVPPRTSAQRIVVSTRVKKFPFRSQANRIVRLNEKGKRKVTFVDDPGGLGSEIVRELMVCPACACARDRG
jgi:hypothetical protein